LISRVTLGEHTVTNVPAVVSPDGVPPLLGMGVLRRFGRFTIDVANGQLILG
jgi:predicted aspartyl protease